MTSQDFLKNLQSIRQLDAVPASPELARRWLAAAQTRLNDAKAVNVSAAGRFDSAYNALRFAADIGLLLHGYRTGSREGHHQIALQSLVHTFGIDAATVRAIDALRRQRHLADYEGDDITPAALKDGIQHAEHLIAIAESRLRAAGWLP